MMAEVIEMLRRSDDVKEPRMLAVVARSG